MGIALSCIGTQLCECAAMCACSCCASFISSTLSQAVRFGHILIIIVTYTIAYILGKYYPTAVNGYYSSVLTTINLTDGCDTSNINECIYRQLMYRSSLSLFLLFLLLSIFAGLFNYINKSLWILKFSIPIATFILFLWADNIYFSAYAEFTRFFSFFWLLIQGFLMFDFAHDCHDYIMTSIEAEDVKCNGDSRLLKFIYLFISIVGMICGFVGISYLYTNYCGCVTGQFFTSLTLILSILTTFLSISNYVNKGLLTPSIMFAYATFICWYSLLSSPDTECNAYALSSDSKSKDASMAIITTISIVILLYCVFTGSKLLNSFYIDNDRNAYSSSSNSKAPLINGSKNTNATTNIHGIDEAALDTHSSNKNGDNDSRMYISANDESSSGTFYERVFFHVFMMLASCYGAMMLTDWGNSNGTSEGGNAVHANVSMWLKIITQWVFFALYLRSLYIVYSDNA